MKQNSNDYLQHYGVLGMKWGRRKARYDNPSDKTKTRPSESTSIISKTKNTKSKKSIKSLSYEELRARINRLNMEKQYRDLLRSDPESKKILNSGKRFVNNIVIPASEDLGRQLFKAAMAKGINTLMKEELVYANNKKKGN